ncbi:LPXTG cell wall anchor domain-containing protein [Micromonospora sp. NIE79]|uniref:LPXTG cell wall anchor domain-containing protein n=1 Tax=Micromonospora trifolii TaxID=2911208 RepID=A0ABS9N8Y6_9ACTN|nr:LPXTG cell wall anchor domain-containing protein [Micromonospora trifolii]MCG5446303.1 LPXTG cell wall anchor domain-containing protein [Micromonospora trifolii]
MNPPKSPFRRVAAIAAGALIGLAGVGVLASPASAHHPEPSGTYCLTSDGQVKVTWTVGNSEDIEAKITKLESTVAADFTGGLTKDATLPAKGKGVLTGTQAHRFDTKRPTIELTVEARWVRSDRIVTEERTVAAEPKGTCAAESTPTPSSPTPTATPSATPTPTPTVASPSPSQSPTQTPPPAATPAPAEPVGSVESTCDKLTFTIENPADGETVTLTLTPNKGEAKTLVVKPGETGSVSFDATEGLVVTPAAEGLDDTAPIAWEQPADCAPGQGGGKDEPALPLTGAATGGIIAGAVVLLAAGAALFVVARRRRVRFTA